MNAKQLDAAVKKCLEFLSSRTVIAAIVVGLAGAAQAKYGFVIDPTLQATVLVPALMIFMRSITKTPLIKKDK
jgi:1,4-dihydroxy-2-naphthoate octaprenyltransferase